ncbi:hypothetical protein [Novosphingobium sp.]|uniref:hypothetical protein n=1 Tax=Novosphingobium sp. TaxID=1874826 RepID=UPI0031DB4589
MSQLIKRHHRLGRMMMKHWLMAVTLVFSATSLAAAPYRTPVPPRFDSRGADRQAIEALLGHYTQAVSTKDQALFETLLLSKAIPFSGVPLSGKGGNAETANYEGFRKAVFEGSPFTQRFQDIHIEQDGPLAHVSLVFVNTTAKGQSWGWKTLQLIKVGPDWKITSEFFTGHD